MNSGVAAADIDCIVAHGTGTKLNDAAEAAAIAARVRRPPASPVTAPKSVVGHTLGAAGAFGVAVGALAVRHGLIPPQHQLRHARPRLPARRSSTARRAGCRSVPRSSNAFGFGGQNAVVVLRGAR